MYKKYITKNGKKIGPYYYTSIRDANKKVKTIYLGRTYEQALRSEHLLSPTRELSQRITTLQQAQQNVSTPLPAITVKEPLPEPAPLPQTPIVPVLQETPAPASAITLQEKYLQRLARQQHLEEERQRILQRIFLLQAPLPHDDIDSEEALHQHYEQIPSSLTLQEEQTQLREFISQPLTPLPQTPSFITHPVVFLAISLLMITGLFLFFTNNFTLTGLATAEQTITINVNGADYITSTENLEKLNIFDVLEQLTIQNLTAGNDLHIKTVTNYLPPNNVTFSQVYALTHNLTFSNATFTAHGTGKLYICNSFDYTTEACTSDWQEQITVNGSYEQPLINAGYALGTEIPETTIIEEQTTQEEIPENTTTTSTNETLVTNETIIIDEAIVPNENISANQTNTTTTTPPQEPIQEIQQKKVTRQPINKETLEHYNVVIGKDVTWVKTITVNETTEQLAIELPKEAQTVKVIKNDDEELATTIVEKSLEDVLAEEQTTQEEVPEKITTTNTNETIVTNETITTHEINITASITPEKANAITPPEKSITPPNITVNIPLEVIALTPEEIPAPTKENETTEFIPTTSINEGLLSFTGEAVITTPPTNILDFFKKIFSIFSTTGLASYETPVENLTVIINETITPQDELSIVYTMPGPTITKETITHGEKITISSELHYENILAYTAIDNIAPENINLYWITNGTKEPIDFTYADYDNNTKADEIQWIIPHLSNQTFEIIILISAAEHLDENKTFLEDIYSQVQAQDNNWTTDLPAGHYIRVTFERPLNASNDITIHARNTFVNETPIINVYEQDQEIILATYPAITTEQTYKIYLTNLTHEQQTFDLQIINGSIAFDYIVDPATITTTTQAEFNAGSFNNTRANSSGTVELFHGNQSEINKSVITAPDYNTNLTLLMHFNNNTGVGENDTQFYDYTGLGNNGTCNAASSLCPVFNLSGKIGNAYSFDGTNDYISVPDSTSLNSTGLNLTVAAWVKIYSNHSGYIASKRSSVDYKQWNLAIASPTPCQNVDLTSSGTSFCFIEYNGNDGAGVTSGDGYNDGQWHHVVATRDGVTLKLFVDGVLKDSASHGGILVNNLGLQIGRLGPSGSQYFNGSLDELAIWNTTLNSTDIANLYERQRGNYPQNGTYTSEIHNLNATQPFLNFSWSPNYGEVPNPFDESSASLRDKNLALLLHLNNDSAYGENDTLFFDYSGEGHNGSCTGTACPNFNTSGKLGNAFSFNGITHQITVNNNASIMPPNEITLMAWVRPTTITDLDTIFGKWSGSNGYFLGMSGTGGAVRFLISTTGGNIDFNSIATISTNRWYHVAANFNGSAARIFINGIEDTQQNKSGTIVASTSNLLLAGPQGGGELFATDLDEMVIWNRSLTAQEVGDIYNRTRYGRVRAQVRSCDDASCNTELFVGPNNQTGKYFLNNTFSNTTFLTNNKYFQYKLYLDNDNNRSENLSAPADSTSFSYERSNTAPTHNAPLLTATSGNNFTTDNLTAYTQSMADGEGDTIYNITTFYVDNVPFEQLVLPFDGTNASIANTTRDYSGYNRHVQLGDGATDDNREPTLTTTLAKRGKAYIFNGSQYINVTNTTAFRFPDNFTIEAFINLSALSSSNHGEPIAARYVGNIFSDSYWFGVRRTNDTAGILEARLYTSNINLTVTGGTAILANKTYHAAFSYNGTRMQLWLDGVSDGTFNTAGQVDQKAEPLLIGADGTGRYFHGMIDELRIYNRTLTANQIYEHNLTRYNTIVSDELQVDQSWIASMTINDGFLDSITKNSTALTTVLAGNTWICDSGQVNSTCYISTVHDFNNSFNFHGLGSLVIQDGGSFYNISGSNLTLNFSKNITIETGGNISSTRALVASGDNYAGGNVNITAGDTVNITGQIIIHGGTSSANGKGGLGGILNLTAGNALFVNGTINNSGGEGTTSAGSAGTGNNATALWINATSVNISGTISSIGGGGNPTSCSDTAGLQGSGGNVSINARTIFISGILEAGRGPRGACQNGEYGRINLTAIDKVVISGTTRYVSDIRASNLTIDQGGFLWTRGGTILDNKIVNLKIIGNITLGPANFSIPPNLTIQRTNLTLDNGSIVANNQSQLFINVTQNLTINNGTQINLKNLGGLLIGIVDGSNLTFYVGDTLNVTGKILVDGNDGYDGRTGIAGNINITATKIYTTGTIQANAGLGSDSAGHGGITRNASNFIILNATYINISGNITALGGTGWVGGCSGQGDKGNGGNITLLGKTFYLEGKIDASRGSEGGCNNGYGGIINVTVENTNITGGNITTLGNATGPTGNGTIIIDYNSGLLLNNVTTTIAPGPHIARTSTYGRIQYLTPITGYASVTNWNTNISITNNSALADGASNSQALNKTAEISLNLSGHGFGGSTPSILREGVTCLEGICSVVNWNPTTTFLVFNVTGFTNYSALGNIVPSLTNAILNVTNETLVPSGDNIQANVTVSDPEGNATNFTIVFFVNNVANITAQLDNNYADGSTISYVFNNTNITTDQTINVQFNATDGSGSSNYLNTSKISTQIQIDPCDIGSPNTTCYISGVKVFPNGYNLQGTGNLIIQNGGSFYNITGSNISFNLANITIQSGGNITSVSSGANAAGTIILNATDTINITDKIIAIGPQNHGGTAGKGGTVNISAPNIILPGSINVTGGKLGSGNNGMPGDGGRVNFNGTSIDFTGRIDANGQSSRWQCIIGTSGHLSDGGIINITGTTVNISGSITVDRGGRVADDCNNGIAGNISIYAQNLNYTGTTNGTANGSLFRPYVLLNVSNTADIYGNITDIYYLRTKTLLLQKNANLGFRQNFVLDTPTKNNFSYWEGNITTSGDVNITATPFQINGSISKTTGTLRIETNTFEFNNSITTTNNTHSAIIINATGSITIKSGLTITADGQGTVPAGNITLIAGGTINITGIVRATGSTDYGATAAKGGNITINARNSVLLPGTVNVTGGRISLGNNGMPGEGGTVSINSTNIEITGKIDLNGQSSRSDCTIGTAGHLSNGGTINITGTTVNITGVIHANRGGPVGASYVCNNGLGGNISITGNNLNLSGATIIALGNHTGNAINGTNSLEYNTNLSTSGTNNITPTPYIARSNNYGRIQYLTPITGYASVTNWNTNISITNNSALADGASNSQALNKTAEITLNLTGHPIVNQPQLLRDSIACGAICTIINWNSITKILTFNVTGFSNYSTSKNNTSPYAIFNRPLQDENYTQDVFNITLNTTVYDQDLDNITTKIYAYGSKQLEVQPDGTSTVALYHLNNDSSVGENDTRIYDFTGLGNNGTCMMVTSGNTGYCPYMNTTGKLGGAVFNGTQGINITYNQLFNLTQKNFTINTWVLPQETVLAPIIILTPGADDKHQYKIYGSAANTWAISVTNTTNNAFSATSTADFTSNTTYTMITLLYNQSNDGTGRITLYTNGQERTNTLIQGNLLDNFTAPLKIGNGTAKAIIDELAIWNRTLTANEVITLYNKQKYGYYTSLVYKGNSTTQNGTQITYNFTTTPIIPDNTTILLMHFDNESWIGENDTRFYDFTGLGNNGSCSKSANTCPLLNQSSKIGWGVEFDATQNISLGIVPALNLTNNISIFAWIRASSKSDGVIISRGDVGNGQFGLGYGMNCAGKLDLYLGAWLCSNVSINDNQWHHVGYTLNQSNLTFFVDGAYAGNFSSGTIAAYGNPETWIGSNNAGGIRLFNGTIDELVVYNRSLNYTEVLDTYRVRIDKYFWKVNVTDGSLQNETVFQRFHIKSGSVNTPPNVTTVAITPTFANTTDRMICTFTVSDPNAGDTLKINVTWYNGTAIYQTNGSFSVTNGTSMQANMTMGAQNKGQAWKCGVTASDQFSIGNQTNGTAVTILNSPPFKPILGLPADNNITTNRTLNMTWSNFSDADEDPITWQINITCLGGCSIDNRIFNSSTNETMPQKDGGSTVDDLNYFSDDGYHYNWSVRGYDNEVFGNWSNEANFSIEALVQITLTNNTILFGSKNIGNKDNTTDDNPNPITIKNQGNSFNNVNISSSDMLWDTKPTASAYYQFKADNISQQQGAFNYSGSITTFTNVPTGNQTTISRYNQSNENNTAEVDILIEVPLDEPPGNKTSLLTFTGYYLRVD